MLDVALFSLATDMAQKSGVEAVRDYWTRVGATYAQRIGTESFVGWPAFNIATKERRTSLTVESEVRVLTDMAIKDTEGNVIGYVYAVLECPMLAAYGRWMSILGQAIPPVDQQITQHYNQSVRDSAVNNFCPCHQMFREEAAHALTIGGNPLECLQLANKSRMGTMKILQSSLEILDLEEKYITSLLREAQCVYALVEKGKIDISGYPSAGSPRLKGEANKKKKEETEEGEAA